MKDFKAGEYDVISFIKLNSSKMINQPVYTTVKTAKMRQTKGPNPWVESL